MYVCVCVVCVQRYFFLSQFAKHLQTFLFSIDTFIYSLTRLYIDF